MKKKTHEGTKSYRLGKYIQAEVQQLFKNLKLTDFPESHACKLQFPFELLSGKRLSFYAFHRVDGKKKISLSTVLDYDLTAADVAGVQELLRQYNLILTEHLTLCEESNRAMPRRITSMLQGLLALDTLARGSSIGRNTQAARIHPPSGAEPVGADRSPLSGNAPEVGTEA